MTLDQDIADVRVIPTNGEAERFLGRWETRRSRTEAQRALDDIFNHARSEAADGRTAIESSLEWAAIAEEVPADFRTIPQLLGRYAEWLDERVRVRT